MKYCKAIFFFLVLLTLLMITGCGCEHQWVEGTCEAPEICSLCGKTRGEPTEHYFREATCESPKTCTKCGLTEGESNGHDFDEATCTSAQKCKNCTKVQGVKLGHDYQKGVCTRCGDTNILSESCDMVLCTGYDGDDYYELVANQMDAYPDSTFEFGVIKNNEWLLKMGEDCPFIDSKGWWKGTKSENTPGEFIYLSEGCFYYTKDQGLGDYEIIYKPETNVSFEVAGLVSFTPYVSNYEIDYSMIVNDNGEVLTRKDDKNYTFSYLNMNTGESFAIPFELTNIHNSLYIGLLSDGLFYAESFSQFSGYDYIGFFDLDGNQIINLLDYKKCDLGDYMYHDGEFTMTCENSSGVEYDITFDTKGKVIKREKR